MLAENGKHLTNRFFGREQFLNWSIPSPTNVNFKGRLTLNIAIPIGLAFPTTDDEHLLCLGIIT
jgi:hypothetical protein